MKDYYVMEYMYRDADNYKAFGEIILSGNADKEFIDFIRSSLVEGEFFVAEQVNIPVLYQELWQYSNGPTIADHAYHELIGFHRADEHEIESLALWGKASDLLDSFRLASQQSWDCSQSVHCAV